jgi:Fic family protein
MSHFLGGSPVGQVTRIRGHDPRFGEAYDVEAFLPNDLPYELSLPASTWLILTEAMGELGRLDAAASLIPRPTLVTRMATRREAIGTSALEGTFAALPELLASEVLTDAERSSVPPNVREVRNYARAAEAAYGWIAERPITLGMISDLQAEIVRGTDSDVGCATRASYHRPRGTNCGPAWSSGSRGSPNPPRSITSN